MHRYIATALIAVSICLQSCFQPPEPQPRPRTVGGSSDRFALMGDQLYTIDNNAVQVFDVKQPNNPVPGAKIAIGTGVEALYVHEDKLLINTLLGLLIYNSHPLSGPSTLLSPSGSVAGCSPVVVQGHYLYTTMRTGTWCIRSSNVLQVVDVSNQNNPAIVQSVAMNHPHGLAIDGSQLFVSEGDFGLKVFHVTDSTQPRQTQWIERIKTYDVVTQNKLLFVIGPQGLYQYDYSDTTRLRLLSTLPFAH